MHTVDVTARPVGTYYGSKFISVACPQCGLPALNVHGGMVHSFELRLTVGNEPRCHWGPECTPASAARARRAQHAG